MFPLLAWAFPSYSSFLPQFKNMHGLISDSKLTVGVNGSLSFCQTNCPAYTLPIALDSWDGLQFPVTLNWKSGRNWKDG